MELIGLVNTLDARIHLEGAALEWAGDEGRLRFSSGSPEQLVLFWLT